MKLPTVALVGRPNVGKSTIFNRLMGKKISIIEDTPGVTRDRIYGVGHYGDYKFNVIDTGGIDLSNEKFNEQIKMQAELAIDEADVVIFEKLEIYYIDLIKKLLLLLIKWMLKHLKIIYMTFMN